MSVVEPSVGEKRPKVDDLGDLRPNKKKYERDPDSLPKSSVKRLMKVNGDVGQIATDALVTTCRATELFIGFLVEESAKKMQESGRKTIKMEDIQSVIDSHENLVFLKDAFGPQN